MTPAGTWTRSLLTVPWRQRAPLILAILAKTNAAKHNLFDAWRSGIQIEAGTEGYTGGHRVALDLREEASRKAERVCGSDPPGCQVWLRRPSHACHEYSVARNRGTAWHDPEYEPHRNRGGGRDG